MEGGRFEGAAELEGVDGARATFRAPLVREESKFKVVVVARMGEDSTAFGMECTSTNTVVPPDVSERIQGIPEPHPVAEVESQRVRYLIHLFAKEVVLRNFGRPGDAEVLERMVEVLTRIGGTR